MDCLGHLVGVLGGEVRVARAEELGYGCGGVGGVEGIVGNGGDVF